MSLREIDNIVIFKNISKYRRVRLINFIQFIMKIMVIPMVVGIAVIFLIKIPDGVTAEGVFEQPNKNVLFGKVNSSIENIGIINGSKVSNGQLLITFNSNEIYSSYIKLAASLSAYSNQLSALQLQMKSYGIEWRIEYSQKKKELTKKENLYKMDLVSQDEYEGAKDNLELVNLKKYNMINLSNDMNNSKANIQIIMK